MTPQTPRDPPAPSPPPVPQVRIEDLLKGARELVIVHGPDLYHLRLTRNGKLILTK